MSRPEVIALAVDVLGLIAYDASDLERGDGPDTVCERASAMAARLIDRATLKATAERDAMSVPARLDRIENAVLRLETRHDR